MVVQSVLFKVNAWKGRQKMIHMVRLAPFLLPAQVLPSAQEMVSGVGGLPVALDAASKS